MKSLPKTILVITLLCFSLYLPNFVFAQSDDLLDKEQIKKYLSIPENDNQQIMHTLIQLLTNELTDAISSDRSPREDGVITTLTQSIKINALKFLLLDAPVEVVQKVVLTSIRIARIAYGLNDLGDVVGLIERETAQNAVKYGLNALLKNDIRVTSGALEINFVSYKNNQQNVIFQYVITLKPNPDKTVGVAINILSKDYFEPPESKGGFGFGTPWRKDAWLAEGHTKIEPFIISINGTMQKGEFNNYYWVDAPSIAISFPDNVPDLGFRPLSFWQRHLWRPIESQIREATVLLNKFLASGSGIVNGISDLWQKIGQAGSAIKNTATNLFSKINNYLQGTNTGASIAGFVYPDLLSTDFTNVFSNNTTTTKQLTIIVEPTKPSKTTFPNETTAPPDQLAILQAQLNALIEQIDNIAEDADILFASQNQTTNQNNAVSGDNVVVSKTPSQTSIKLADATSTLSASASAQATTSTLPQNTTLASQLTSNQPTIVPPPPPVQILISEVKTESQNSTSDEYIELYNPNNFTVNLGGLILRKKTSSGVSESTLVSSSKFQGNIAAFGYFLITPQSTSTGSLHYSGAGYYIAQTNAILLYDKYERFLDKVETVVHPRTHSFGRNSPSAASDFEVQLPTPGYNNQKDTIAPRITILTKPNATTTATTAEFSFTADKPDCIFDHQLDNNPPQQSSGGQTPTLVRFKNLAVGQHTFQIRAQDPVGNLANPAQYFWEIVVPPNQPPIAAFSYSPSEIFVNEPVIFNAADSTDSDGAVVSYAWNFGDSSATATQSTTISHQFSTSGQFQVGLVVSDNKGATSSPTTATVIVVPQPKILISEIQTESATSAKDEFIELFNPNNFSVELNKYGLKKKTSSGEESNLVSPSRFAGTITALGYFLITPQATSSGQATGDLYYSGETYSIAQNNTILLYSRNNNLVDKVGFGSANDFETAPAINHPKGYTLGRKWLTDNQSYQDTDNNQDDFEIQIPTPGLKNEKDTTPPETEIISKPPALTNQTQAIFSFSSNEEGSTFQCNLNSGGWQNCALSITYPNLPDGLYSFQVKAIDLVNNEDQSPAQYIWAIDTTIASPFLILADSETNSLSLTNKQTVKASISQDEDALYWFLSEGSIKPTVQNANWLASKPLTFNLSPNNGTKTVFVWTKDAADNISQLGNSASIVLDTIAPQTRIDQAPINPTNQSQAVFAFSSNETGANFLCKLDAANWLACASSTVFNNLNEGTRSLEVKALDLALNIDESPAQYNWLIDITPPLSWIESMAASSTSTTALVKWNGSDAGSGISEYDIQYKDNEDGEWQYLAQATTSLQANFIGENGRTYYFRSKATDTAGNEKAWPEEAETFCKIEIPEQPKAILEVSTTGSTSTTSIALFFSATQGAGNPPSKYLTIKNSGQAEMAWGLTTASIWNWVSPTTTSGTLLANASTSVEIAIDIAKLEPGNYQATTTITADKAENSPQIVQINLAFEELPNELPNATFSYSPNENLLVGNKITFDASSSTDDGEITAFIWNFGDGSTTTAQIATTSHIFNTAGQFQILLFVQDDKGATSSPVSATLTIGVRPESRLLISEVQVRDKASSTNDFVEIFNPSNQAIDISNFQLKKQTSTGTSTGYSLRVFPANSAIPANGYFLWANSDYIIPGLIADATSTQTLANNNSLALFYSDHATVIDQVAWGSSTDPFMETTPFTPNPANNQTLTRRQDGSANYLDTNNNAADFVLAGPTPTNSQGQTIATTTPATTTPATSTPATSTPTFDPSLPVITDLEAAAAADRNAVDLWWSYIGASGYLINYNNQTIHFTASDIQNIITATVGNLTGGVSATFTVQYITAEGATSGPSNMAVAIPLLDFQDNGDGTIDDLYSGLMWPKDGTGLAANNGQPLAWFEAKDFCERLIMCQNNQFVTTSSTSSDQAIAACADKGGVKYDDWRLPGIKELATLIKYQKNPFDGIMIDTNYFQNIAAGKYWSASFKQYGWAWNQWFVRWFDSSNGFIGIENIGSDPTITGYFLPVRGNSAVISVSGFDEPPTGCSLGFQDNGDGSITDLCSGLMWTNSFSGDTVFWVRAMENARDSTIFDHNDWRLPNIRELLMIINNPYQGSPNLHWSITPDYQHASSRWIVDLASLLGIGQTQTRLETGFNYFRFVRNP